jgi:hypothetical protein
MFCVISIIGPYCVENSFRLRAVNLPGVELDNEIREEFLGDDGTKGIIMIVTEPGVLPVRVPERFDQPILYYSPTRDNNIERYMMTIPQKKGQWRAFYAGDNIMVALCYLLKAVGHDVRGYDPEPTNREKYNHFKRMNELVGFKLGKFLDSPKDQKL